MPLPASSSKSAFRKVRGKVKNAKFAAKSARPMVVDTSYSLGPNGRLQPLEQTLIYPESSHTPKRTRLGQPHIDDATPSDPDTLPTQDASIDEHEEDGGSVWVDIEPVQTTKPRKRKAKVRPVIPRTSIILT